MTLDPSKEQAQTVYKLMIGIIVPRPIAFVSTENAQGARNLAPFSFFTAISANPPIVCFSPMRNGRGEMKDTLRNIEATGEYTINIVSEDFADKMNLCSGEYPPEVDEFKVSGLTPVASDIVKPARVGESRASMECRLVQIVEASKLPLGGSLVMGEVVRFHIAEEISGADLRVDPDKLNAIGRMGGPTYTRTHDRFDIQRPVVVK